MMEKVQDKLKAIFERKCALLQEMESNLNIQEELLGNGDYEALNRKTGEVEEIVAKLKENDYEIARLESFDDTREVLVRTLKSENIRKSVDRMLALAKKNRASMKTIANRLEKIRNRVKSELDDTVNRIKVSGYKPRQPRPPVYLDKHS